MYFQGLRVCTGLPPFWEIGFTLLDPAQSSAHLQLDKNPDQIGLLYELWTKVIPEHAPIGPPQPNFRVVAHITSSQYFQRIYTLNPRP